MIAERLTAQLLAGPPARDPVAAVERILCVQGQDPRGARLAVRARTTGLVAADIDRAFTDERSLLITWLGRGTLHLIRSEDYPWLQALLADRLLTGTMTRLSQEGVEPRAADRGVDVIERTLAKEGPLAREPLRERVKAAGVPADGQVLIYLLALASTRGLIVRGPMIGRQHAFALVRDWLGEPGPVDRDAALAELARRYLAGHGPANDRDLAQWTGLPLRDVRKGLSAIATELDQLDDGLVDLKVRPPAAELPPPRLLGPFDPVLHGWVSREPILGRHAPRITRQGMFGYFALVDGRAVAVWRLKDGKVELEPLERLPKQISAALREDAAAVERFFA